ncbi:DUF6247 family protein [Nonomuraea sp. NPDC049784]|uniref:DUF6247 family protein n=1 Tax=Nonomuraea sp. NPDC049784 TaxID=3154361 RepID=UPI0033C0F456
MSAQPVHDEDPEDPQVILRDLPAQERPEFLRQYQEAAQAARDDPSKFRNLVRLLKHWRLAVVATNQPGYYEAITSAKIGALAYDAAQGQAVPLDEAVAAVLARRR